MITLNSTWKRLKFSRQILMYANVGAGLVPALFFKGNHKGLPLQFHNRFSKKTSKYNLGGMCFENQSRGNGIRWR